MKRRMDVVSGWIAAVLLLLLLLAITAVTGLPSAAAPIGEVGTSLAQTSKQVSYNGISFAYDSSLASDVVASVVTEDKGGPNVPCWITHPDEVIFEFKDFAYSTNAMMPARIYVLPTSSDYRCLNPSETIDNWGREVDTLRDLISRRPKLTEPTTAQGATPIPFLPPINAGGFIVGKQSYLNFRNGSGIRYLVQFAQEVRPASREDTRYTYQGMTRDGKYYVAAQFPAFLATPPNLPNPQTGTQQDLDNYYVQLRGVVDQTSNAGFLPDLSSLDSIVNSLIIKSSAVALPSGSSSASLDMPPTGTPATLGLLSTTGLAVLALAFAFFIILIGLLVQWERSERRQQATKGRN